MTQAKQYTVEPRENEVGEEYTVLLDNDGNEIATQWGDCSLKDFTEQISVHKAKSEAPVAPTQKSAEGQTKFSTKRIPRDMDAPAFAYSEADEQAAADSAVRNARSLHTPVPWEISRTSNGFLVSHKTRCIAAVDGLDMDEQVEADARLIAAAPDLLETCKRLADAGSPDKAALQDALIVIARAEDRS